MSGGVATPHEILDALKYVNEHRVASGAFEVVLMASYPDNRPDPTPEVIRAYEESGVTWWFVNGISLDETRVRAREGPLMSRL